MKRSMSFCVLLLIVVCTMLSALAVSEGGTMTRISEAGAKSIRLEREWVNIEANKDNYSVELTYKFVNDSDKETLVKMGYPEMLRGEEKGKAAASFSDFKMSIGEEPVKALLEVGEKTGATKFWVKNVNFLGKQTRNVVVKFTTKYISSKNQECINYHFTDGKWSGTVSSSELLLTVKAPGTWAITPGTEMKHAANRYYKKWSDWKPKDDISIMISPAMPETVFVAESPMIAQSLVTNPGKSEVKLVPNALQKNGMIYIKLDDIANHMNGVILNWNAKTNAELMQRGGVNYTFTSDSDIMKVDAADIKMEGKAFLIADPQKKGEQLMYVPLSALTKQMDGTYEHDKSQNTVKYSFKAYTPVTTVPEVPKVIPPEVPKPVKADLEVTHQVTITTAKGDIVVDLYGNEAPKTVTNFVKLVKQGFYDGLTFHRVETMAGFQLIQGGDPQGNGMGDSPDKVKLEISPKLKHWEGAIGMARTQLPDSASCQFYICTCPIPALDGMYAIFGKVNTGLDIAKKTEVGDVMTKVTVVELAPIEK